MPWSGTLLEKDGWVRPRLLLVAQFVFTADEWRWFEAERRRQDGKMQSSNPPQCRQYIVILNVLTESGDGRLADGKVLRVQFFDDGE